jgi:hypothetical protein
MAIKPTRGARIAALCCVPAFLFMVVVRQYFTREMPEMPDATAGRLLPVLVNYGKTVYVTATEQKVLYAAYIILSLVVICTIVLYLLTQAERKPSRLP